MARTTRDLHGDTQTAHPESPLPDRQSDEYGRFVLMAKPTGPRCNLRCRYCYYLGKDRLYPDTKRFRMDAALLEAFVRDYIEAHGGPEIPFVWQGGEPTLLGLPFFRKVLDLQQRHCPAGKTVSNALQTNGTLLDGEWAAFLRDNDFLVGISIDGPRELHDHHRRDARGKPSFDAVLGALRLLRDEGVEFNTLTVVSRSNAKRGRSVYRFLKREGVQFMQFIPIVEQRSPAQDAEQAPPGACSGARKDAAPRRAPWSVPPKGFGQFLCAVFDEWYPADVGTIYVQLFDNLLGQWLGGPSALCVHARVCGQGPILEHNGDVYACDHYVYPTHRLGNILEDSLADMVRSPRQQRFGEDKERTLPGHCRRCACLPLCNGGCPKHRFARAPNGEGGLNYLCPSYRMFYSRTAPHMRAMAERLRWGHPAAP